MAFWHDWVSNKRKGSKVESRRGAVGAALVTFKTSEQNICELRDSTRDDLLAVKPFVCEEKSDTLYCGVDNSRNRMFKNSAFFFGTVVAHIEGDLTTKRSARRSRNQSSKSHFVREAQSA